MITHDLSGHTILITGGARRLGRTLALSAAKAGADILLHHAHSPLEANQTAEEIHALGRKVWIVQANLLDNAAIQNMIETSFNLAPLTALINNAAIFKAVDLENTSLTDWHEHLQINLTAPFLLSQAFAKKYSGEETGRILNILDWRALRPGKDHFPYTISKAALAAMTKSMALALAPRILVNGIALGAILPPAGEEYSENLIKYVPMKRWSDPEEMSELVNFLLLSPSYITGEIIHLDGGRHLV